MRNVISGFVVLLFIGGCANKDAAQKAFLDENLACPTPAVEQFEPWGQSGSAHICKIKHGPFVAYENGYVHVRGQYENGKEAGVWRWYNADGKVEKQVDYANALPVADAK